MPSKVLPLHSIWTVSWTKRPPMIHLRWAVPAAWAGGLLGSVHSFAVMAQSPTKGSSFLCSGPGVPALARAFSKSLGLGGVLLSCAMVQLANTARANASAVVTPTAIRNLFITFSFLRPLDDE